MKNILERNILEFINTLEGSPHEAIAFLTIADSLYGNTEADVGFFLYTIYIGCGVLILKHFISIDLVRHAIEHQHPAGVFENC